MTSSQVGARAVTLTGPVEGPRCQLAANNLVTADREWARLEGVPC